MSANSRLTIAVHALTWMALASERGDKPMTSDEIAASVNTNPVVIRRSLGDLHRAGLVHVQRGAHAGWSLTRPPTEITLLDVYEAVEQPPLFALHHTEPNLECPVGHGIRPVLLEIYGAVDDTVQRELARTTIATVLRSTLGVAW